MKTLYIVTEGKTDAQILRSLLDCSAFNKVYSVIAQSFSSIPTVSQRVIVDMKAYDKMLIVFDSNTKNKELINDRMTTLEFLTGAESDRNYIGIFCMIPDIQKQLNLPIENKRITESFITYLRENQYQLKARPIIKEMQAFLTERQG